MSSKPAVTLTIAGDADRLSRATTQATRSVDDMGGKVTKQSEAMASASEKHSGRVAAAVGLAGTAIAGAAVAGVNRLFDLSKSMESLDVKAKTVFQDQLPGIQAWAEANRKAFGDSARNVVAMAANLADLLKPMGFTSAQAADMSKKILDLSGALSRWSGGTKTAAEVSEVLADAMLGETDGLKALGISISAAEVDAKALSMGLGKSSVDMLKVRQATLAVSEAQTKLSDALKTHGKGSAEAAKASLNLEKAQRGVEDAMAGGKAEISDQARALATQQLILEKSTDAQAAWADGGRAAAEKQNALSSTMAESAEKLATIVTPVFSKLVEVVGGLAQWASENQGIAITIGVVTAAVWLLNAALNANPIVLVVSLIVGLGAALAVLWTKSETFRNVVTAVWDRVVGAITGAVSGIRAAWDAVVGFFGSLPGRIGAALGSLGDVIGNAFKAGLNIAINALNWGIRRINDLLHGINWVTKFVGIPAIPDIPEIARLHTGGVVPGQPGTETLVLARAGERMDTGVGGAGEGGVGLYVDPSSSGPVSDLLDYLVRTGAVQGVRR